MTRSSLKSTTAVLVAVSLLQPFPALAGPGAASADTAVEQPRPVTKQSSATGTDPLCLAEGIEDAAACAAFLEEQAEPEPAPAPGADAAADDGAAADGETGEPPASDAGAPPAPEPEPEPEPEPSPDAEAEATAGQDGTATPSGDPADPAAPAPAEAATPDAAPADAPLPDAPAADVPPVAAPDPGDPASADDAAEPAADGTDGAGTDAGGPGPDGPQDTPDAAPAEEPGAQDAADPAPQPEAAEGGDEAPMADEGADAPPRAETGATEDGATEDGAADDDAADVGATGDGAAEAPASDGPDAPGATDEPAPEAAGDAQGEPVDAMADDPPAAPVSSATGTEGEPDSEPGADAAPEAGAGAEPGADAAPGGAQEPEPGTGPDAGAETGPADEAEPGATAGEPEAPAPQAEADACVAEVIASDGTRVCVDEGGAQAVDALAAGRDGAAAATGEVTTETVTDRTARSSSEEFRDAPPPAEGAAADGETADGDAAGDDDGRAFSTLERAGLFALGAAAVGAILSTGERVAENTGDRVVVVDEDGDYRVLKDDDALLRQPGTQVRTERFEDGSSTSIVTRPDGTEIVTVRDANGRVLRRVRYGADGGETVLFDDTRRYEPVDLRALPQPAGGGFDYADGTGREDLRAAMMAQDARAIDRTFSLRQVRDIREVRELVPEINLRNITFETGSAAIQPSQAERLGEMGRLMRDLIAEDPGELFLIEGHTDAVGSASYNLLLSDRRAETVALALNEYFDVPVENMVIQGYGERFLRVDTQGAERLNRRVAVRRITPLLE